MLNVKHHPGPFWNWVLGTGLLTLELLDQSDVDMIATDASEDMLRLASSRLAVFPERSRVEVLDFSNGLVSIYRVV